MLANTAEASGRQGYRLCWQRVVEIEKVFNRELFWFQCVVEAKEQTMDWRAEMKDFQPDVVQQL
jgi:hypothetical protein